MYPETSVNLGNLLLSFSDALDLGSPALAQHQRRTAFVAWEMCKAAGCPADTTERVYVAGLLHEIGAFSLEEKTQLHAGEISDPEVHCVRGGLLFEDIPWLAPAAGIVRYYHRGWE